MFEKLLEILERIAVALERSAAYANTAPKTVNNGAAGKAPKDEAAASPLSGKPSSSSTSETATTSRKNGKDAAADDGLGDEPKTITFEDMRAKMVAVKQHPKLGPTKSSKIFEEYGKLPEIKESDYAAVVAKCDKLLKSVA
jgi:hypothetical protein